MIDDEDLTTEKHLNKGMRIWKAKREKRFKQAREIKPEQENICRFVNFRNTVHRKVNGKFIHPKIEHLQGLQIKNRVYYIKDNEVSYVLINKHGAGITKVHEGIPEWAPPSLIEKYNATQEKFSKQII